MRYRTRSREYLRKSSRTRLRPFLKKLPKDHKFALEIRNKNWLVPQFMETLRERGVALALIDQSWMPRPAQRFEKFDPITADFTYVRWLGDRIRTIREAKNLSQGDIEKRWGLLRAYISRVENGHTLPSVETLEKRAEPPGGFSLGLGPDNAA